MLSCFLRWNIKLIKSKGNFFSTMAKIIKLSNPVTESELKTASESLLNGNIIGVPTDTIYGIAGLAQNTNAVNRIYNIKKRDVNKPIAISVSKIDDIYKWSEVTVSKDLLNDLLPGPVTVIFERTSDLNPDLNAETSLIGIRIPDHEFIMALAAYSGGPIALTSANISSEKSTLNVEEFEGLWTQLDMVCDGGQLGNTDFSRKGSTVVDLSVKGTYKIIREGSARKETVQILDEKYGLEERT